eukprot:m.225416 g.225416  ORF g.225416 m.225416 type:complete len:436 (+) comp15957_c0_seq1:129-1436(+)
MERHLKDAESCAKWLKLRLGSTGETWGGSEQSVGAVISKDSMHVFRECFPLLDPAIKVGLLFSLTHKTPAELSELGEDTFLVLGENDADDWVRVVHHIVSDHVAGRPPQASLVEKHDIFKKAISMIEKTISSNPTTSELLPLEASYLCPALVKQDAENDKNIQQTEHCKLRKRPVPAGKDKTVVYKGFTSTMDTSGNVFSMSRKQSNTGFSSGRRTGGAKLKRRQSTQPGTQKSRREIMERLKSETEKPGKSGIITLSIDELPIEAPKEKKRKTMETVAEETGEPTEGQQEGQASEMDGFYSASAPTDASAEPNAYSQFANEQDESKKTEQQVTGAEQQEPDEPLAEPIDPQVLHEIFGMSNKLSSEAKARIERFLRRQDVEHSTPIEKVTLHEERKPIADKPGFIHVERIVLEMTFATGSWRKLLQSKDLELKK